MGLSLINQEVLVPNKLPQTRAEIVGIEKGYCHRDKDFMPTAALAQFSGYHDGQTTKSHSQSHSQSFSISFHQLPDRRLVFDRGLLPQKICGFGLLTSDLYRMNRRSDMMYPDDNRVRKLPSVSRCITLMLCIVGCLHRYRNNAFVGKLTIGTRTDLDIKPSIVRCSQYLWDTWDMPWKLFWLLLLIE
jgi:hypothetical protein